MNELVVTLKRAGWRALNGAFESAPILGVLNWGPGELDALDTPGDNFKAAAAIVGVRALAAGYLPIAAYVKRKAANGYNGINYGPDTQN